METPKGIEAPQSAKTGKRDLLKMAKVGGGVKNSNFIHHYEVGEKKEGLIQKSSTVTGLEPAILRSEV